MYYSNACQVNKSIEIVPSQQSFREIKTPLNHRIIAKINYESKHLVNTLTLTRDKYRLQNTVYVMCLQPLAPQDIRIYSC